MHTASVPNQPVLQCDFCGGNHSSGYFQVPSSSQNARGRLYGEPRMSSILQQPFS